MSDKMSPAEAFRTIVDKKLHESYGHVIPPSAYVTPFGIKTLDNFLGGGLMSSMANMFSSTPETGKSTIALQFSSMFLQKYPNSISIYFDRESTETEDGALDIEDRLETFGIDRGRFLYRPVVATVPEIFGMINEAIQAKNTVQKKLKTEYFLNIVWDSVASTPCSKHADAMNPKELIGFKANEISLFLAKHSASFAMERVTFTIIDQVRDNIQVEMPWQKAANERSVGEFGNVKAATNVKALQHNVRQWLFLSKGEILKPSDSYGIDGWIINILTVKNKLAPSQYWIPLVFDKKWGIIPIWSEYYFLSEMTKTEKRYWKDKPPYPLCIEGSTNKRILSIMDPSTGSMIYESDSFNERHFIDKYQKDQEFQMWFDKAVEISVDQRIKVALFRENPKAYEVIVDSPSIPDDVPIFSEATEDFIIPPGISSSRINHEYIPDGDV